MLLIFNKRTIVAIPSRVSRITQTRIRVVFVDASSVHTSIDTFLKSLSKN